MKPDENRNMFIFIVLMMVVLGFYQFVVVAPQEKLARQRAALASASLAHSKAAITANAPSITSDLTREAAMALSPRLNIDTPTLKGSITLAGGRIDDLSLARYHTTTDPKSSIEPLLFPKGMGRTFYVDHGWSAQNVAGLPDEFSTWTVVSGSTLSPGHTVVLGFTGTGGLSFTRTLSVDQNYLITVTDAVKNSGTNSVTLAPFARIVRLDTPKHKQAMAFEGAQGSFKKPDTDHYSDQWYSYHDWAKNRSTELTSKGGWAGVSDTYWLTALIPEQTKTVGVQFKAEPTEAVDDITKADHVMFVTAYSYAPLTLAPGTEGSVTHRIFAGPKQTRLLKAYEASLGVPRLHYAIDWGHLYFWLTQPIAWLLEWLFATIGNFGLALLSLTVIIRLILFPFNHKSYESMIKMKAVQERLQPKLDALKARFGDDPQKLQTETMELYQREKVNPLAQMGGCIPMLLQFPVFIALTRVFYVSIEMRQAPFFNLIKDLSQRDPTTIFNLFGLIPYDPAHVPLIGGVLDGFGHIGVWAILYGAITWVSQQLSPMTTVDPSQKRMMQIMPVFIAVLMASLPVGLLVYYSWSTVLTILQQYVLMRHFKVHNVIDDTLARLSGKPLPSAAAKASGIIEGKLNPEASPPEPANKKK